MFFVGKSFTGYIEKLEHIHIRFDDKRDQLKLSSSPYLLLLNMFELKKLIEFEVLVNTICVTRVRVPLS